MTKAQAFELVETLRTAIQAAHEILTGNDGSGGLDYSTRCEQAEEVLYEALQVEDEATKGGAELVK